MEGSFPNYDDQSKDDYKRWQGWVDASREQLRTILHKAEIVRGACSQIEEADRLFFGSMPSRTVRVKNDIVRELMDDLSPRVRVGEYVSKQWPGLYEAELALAGIADRLEDSDCEINATVVEGLGVAIERLEAIVAEMDEVDVNAELYTGPTIEPIVTMAEAFATKPRRRVAYDRDHWFLDKYEAVGQDTFHSPATIRAKWNDMHKEHREAICPDAPHQIADGKNGTDTVNKGIRLARSERDNEK